MSHTLATSRVTLTRGTSSQYLKERAYHISKGLLAVVIGIKVEIQHSEGRVSWVTIENRLDDGSATHGLTAPKDAIDPEKGVSFGFPTNKSTALDRWLPEIGMAPS